MKVGFTGTQEGMSDKQKDLLRRELISLKATEFHHGDCIGADAEADKIARQCGVPVIVIHPPENQSKQAFCGTRFGEDGDSITVWRQAKPYLDRNHDIVDETEILIAAPKSDVEELRSGTWATIRYSRKLLGPGRALLTMPR